MLIWKMIWFYLKLNPVKAELLLDTVGIRQYTLCLERCLFPFMACFKSLCYKQYKQQFLIKTRKTVERSKLFPALAIIQLK